MSTAILMNTCTVCGAEESLDGLLLRMIDDDEVRRLIADVVTASLPLGGLVVRYLRLHKPPKQKLRMSAVAKVLAELVPDMRRGQIERGGRIWHVGHDSWRAAIQAVFDAHDKGTLSVPLPSNAYLYQVLMRMADKTEAIAEQQVDETRRSRSGDLKQDAQSLIAVLDQQPSPVVAADVVRASKVFIPPIPRPRTESPTVRAFKAQLTKKFPNDLSTERE